MDSLLRLTHVSKSYGALEVLSDISADFFAPGVYCLSAPSGSGKTTLFRLIMGLEMPDSGAIKLLKKPVRFSAIFQDDRLIEHLSPIENLSLILGKGQSERIRRELCTLLPKESITRPVCTLSGGMKRRCAFLRAMLAPSDIVIMDEPFTGLDSATRDLVIEYLLKHQEDRLFLIATHQEDDIKKLGAAVFYLGSSQK